MGQDTRFWIADFREQQDKAVYAALRRFVKVFEASDDELGFNMKAAYDEAKAALDMRMV